MRLFDGEGEDKLVPDMVNDPSGGPSLFSVLEPQHPPPLRPKVPPPPPPTAVPAADDKVNSLALKVEELEKKLVTAEGSPAPAKGNDAASELVRFLQTRVAALENKVLETQEVALLSQLKLQEREEVERRVHAETEEMLKAVKNSAKNAELQRLLTEKIEKIEQENAGLRVELLELRRSLKDELERKHLELGAVFEGEVAEVKKCSGALAGKITALEDWQRKTGGWEREFEEVAALRTKLGILQVALARLHDVEFKMGSLAGVDEILQVLLSRASQVEGEVKALDDNSAVSSLKASMACDQTEKLNVKLADVNSHLNSLFANVKELSRAMDELKVKQAGAGTSLESQGVKIEGLEKRRKELDENLRQYLKNFKGMAEGFGC